MTDQKIRTFINVWKISKNFYPHPEPYLWVISLCLLMTTLLSIGLPYLLKLLVDQSQAHTNVYSFKDFFSIDLLYLLALAYAFGWLMNEIIKQMNGLVSSLFIRKLDSSLIFEGMKNYFSLKYDVQKKTRCWCIQHQFITWIRCIRSNPLYRIFHYYSHHHSNFRYGLGTLYQH